jgi:hypothetical protein
MPTANIYTSGATSRGHLAARASELRAFIAKQLSCGERQLQPDEISIRIHENCGSAMIAPLEIEVTAHAYAERSTLSDEICLKIREFVMQLVPQLTDARVWLLLVDLGHSWHE